MSRFTEQQIKALQLDYSRIDFIDPCETGYKNLCATLDRMDNEMLNQVADANIKFMSQLAQNRVRSRYRLAEKEALEQAAREKHNLADDFNYVGSKHHY